MRPFLTLIPLLPLLSLLAACDRGREEERLRGAPPAAAVLAPTGQADRLDERLEALEAELEAALGGELDRLLRAEAITDRLMEAQRRVDWLASGYDIEARLRQLQAMADRVVAILRRGATLETVEEDVGLIRAATRDLRERMRAPGGGAAPPPLDSLLNQDPLRDVRSPAGQRASATATATGSPAGTVVAPTTEPAAAAAAPEPARVPPRAGPLGVPVTPPDTSGLRP